MPVDRIDYADFLRMIFLHTCIVREREMKKDRIPAYKTEYGLLPYSEARKKKYTSKQLEQLEYVPSALPRYPMLQSFDFTQDSMDILLRYEELFQKQSQCKREWREQR